MPAGILCDLSQAYSILAMLLSPTFMSGLKIRHAIMAQKHFVTK